MVGDETGVRPHAADEVGAATVLEALPEDVQPGTVVTPRRWRISPRSSSTGRCSQSYARRKPVAHTIVVMPAARRSISVRASGPVQLGDGFGSSTSSLRPETST